MLKIHVTNKESKLHHEKKAYSMVKIHTMAPAWLQRKKS
jgi:hypothetical protein